MQTSSDTITTSASLPNVRLRYLYRDAGNYKNYGEVIFRNSKRLPIAFLREKIASQLMDGVWLEHEKWNVPSLFFPEKNEDDHDWHEFVSLEETEETETEEREVGEWMRVLLWADGIMDTSLFLNISKIIERESKSTTYKFALSRGVIDIIGNNSPYIRLEEGEAYFPLGLLIEKWLLYYYPIFDSEYAIPQINGITNLAFQSELLPVIAYYKTRGGISVFYNELRTKGISPEIELAFRLLVKKIGETIVRMPMKYIGTSVNNDYYSIFR